MSEKTKRVLIISPYFVPYNMPDMQRVRMSLPYFKEFGWQADVVTVSPKYTDVPKDPLLAQTVPEHISIHYVNALPKEKTIKFGLGSVALRSLKCYYKKVKQLLGTRQYDLIYFSTTQYPVCILGPLWKKRYGVPYIIDIQDPWHTDYYKNKPRVDRPRKYWFSYHLNKYLEPIAMKECDGLISVSQAYLDDLTTRYPKLKQVPQSVITFGYSEIDRQLANTLEATPLILPENSKLQLLYTGVLGPMMHKSLDILMKAFKEIPNFTSAFHLSFIGTSYATGSKAKKTAFPIAKKYNLDTSFQEQPGRIGAIQTLNLLNHVDGLILIGTDDPGYTASKLYPYLQAKKPILAVLHSKSSASAILKSLSDAFIIDLDGDLKNIRETTQAYLSKVSHKAPLHLDESKFSYYAADQLTKKQTEVFNQVLKAQYMQ